MSDPTNVENYTEGIRQLGEISKNTGKSMDELQATITSGKFEESRLSANASQLKINDEKIQTLRSAIEQYQAKYEGYMAKIPQEYRDKIESGALTLENFAQETSKDTDMFNYVVTDGSIISQSEIPTKDWIEKQGYATKTYVDEQIAALDFVTKDEISDYVADVISTTLDPMIDARIETKLNESLNEVEDSDISNLF